MTLISVIIPTYNRHRLLVERALPSVFAQTVQDFEVLVIGDGTDRATVRAMHGLERRDPRVSFWNLRHAEYPEDEERRWGLLAVWSLNFGLDQARGEWIAVLGDDDEWTPDHHEVLLRAAEREGADFAYGMSDTLKGDPPRLTEQLYGKLPPGPAAFCDGANLYRRSLGYRYAPDCWDRELPADGDLWARMVAGGVRFTFIEQIVHHYYRHYP